MKIEKQSMFTGKIHSMDLDITEEEIVRWQSGENIQNVFPHLSADQREFLKTGVTAEEWDSAFGE